MKRILAVMTALCVLLPINARAAAKESNTAGSTTAGFINAQPVLPGSELVDTDGDALPDIWETDGYDVLANGETVHVPLNEMGADPTVKDIFVEIDWMVRPKDVVGLTVSNYRPTEKQMRTVYEAFKNSPVDNGKGIRLHLDYGPDSVDFVTGKKWSEYPGGSGASRISFDDVIDYKSSSNEWSPMIESNFTQSRMQSFHYAIFGNKYDAGSGTSSSGISNGIVAQYMIVSCGGFLLADIMVSCTFMHELGHNLGLGHGGGDNENYKPNYLSIMNYSFQMTGLSGTGAADYSRYELPSLDENNLNEKDGIDPHGQTAYTGLGTRVPRVWYDKVKLLTWIEYKKVGNVSKKAINWNHSLTLGKPADNHVMANLNPGGAVYQAEFDVLTGFDDWANLNFKGGQIGTVLSIPPVIGIDASDEPIKELTLKEALSRGVAGIGYNLPSFTLPRGQTSDVFEMMDTDNVNWISNKPDTLSIDNCGNLKFGSGTAGTVTITAVDAGSGQALGKTLVKTTETWPQRFFDLADFLGQYLSRLT